MQENTSSFLLYILYYWYKAEEFVSRRKSLEMLDSFETLFLCWIVNLSRKFIRHKTSRYNQEESSRASEIASIML